MLIQILDRHGRLVTQERMPNFHGENKMGIEKLPSIPSNYLDWNDLFLLPSNKVHRDPILVMALGSSYGHGDFKYYFWSLGKRPKCLLGLLSPGQNCEIVQDQKHLEVRYQLDPFAYSNGGFYLGDMFYLLRLAKDRFIDRSFSQKRLLRSQIVKTWNQFANPEADDSRTYKLRVAENLLALGWLLGSTHQIWQGLKSKVSTEEFAWLLSHKESISGIVRTRTWRTIYPQAYSNHPIRFRDKSVSLLDQRLGIVPWTGAEEQ